nr:CHAD domain-containing protein [Candidatus Dependentiae bacterium]
KKITKVLGPARDIDIQIEFLTKYIESISLSDKKNKPGLSRMLWRLKHKRNKSQIKLNKTLNDFKKSNFINDFQKKLNLTVLKNQIKKIENSGDAKVSKKIFEQSSSLTGKQQMLNSLKEVILKSAVIKNINLSENDLSANNTNTEFYSADKILDSSFIFENADALHILRKSIKTLRYQMEIFNFYFDNIFDKNIKTIKDMQTILGDIHDCDVWIGLLPVFLKKEKKRTLKYFGNTRNFYKLQNGAVNLFNDRIIKRNLLYSELLKLWNDFELTGFFDKLKNKIIKFKHKN